MTEEEAKKLKVGDKIKITQHAQPMLVGWTVRFTGVMNSHVLIALVDEERRDELEMIMGYRLILPIEISLFIRQCEPVEKVAPAKDPRFPHECYRCKGPAYIGAVQAAFECKRGCKW